MYLWSLQLTPAWTWKPVFSSFQSPSTQTITEQRKDSKSSSAFLHYCTTCSDVVNCSSPQLGAQLLTKLGTNPAFSGHIITPHLQSAKLSYPGSGMSLLCPPLRIVNLLGSCIALHNPVVIYFFNLSSSGSLHQQRNLLSQAENILVLSFHFVYVI